MATAPYFVLSPNTLVSIAGLLHGPDRTVATPPEDWRQATVDVVIPAFNEEHTIALCLASVAQQTLRPRRIILIDDGSADSTLAYAKAFCQANGIDLLAIRRKAPIGKTPTIKRQAREFDSDVEFVLDGDTILESPNYIARTVEELYKAVGIASACGTILPLRNRDRRKLLDTPTLRKFLGAMPDAPVYPPNGWFRRLRRGITNAYRDALYLFLQRFVYRGQMVFFGTITNPVGCAVAYRRKYVKNLFDQYEPILGDDLTNSEDIFIGFALLNQGYRNIQLMDVYARSMEPEAHRLPRQLYMWSSSFLQSCYYFDMLLRSPFKSLKRFLHVQKSKQAFAEKRKIKEPYRQAFGFPYTNTYGRPIGWVLLAGAIEKVSFPVVLFLMALFRLWEPLAVTLAVETALAVGILTVIASGRRLEYLVKGLAVTPIRYASLAFDLFTLGVFSLELWIFRKSRRWRK